MQLPRQSEEVSGCWDPRRDTRRIHGRILHPGRQWRGGYLGPIQPGSQCRHDPVSASQASPCRQRGHGWRQPSPWKPGAQRSLHKVPFQPGWHARQKPSTGEQGWLRLQFPQLHGHRGGEASASSPSPKKMLHPTRAAQTSPSPIYLPIQPKGRMYPVDFPPRSAPSSPVHTLRPVFPRRARLLAAPALVPGDAAAVPAEGVAGAVQAVAAPLAPQPPKPSLALALARLLGAGREVAGALEAAPPAPPARQAVAVPGQGVAVRVGGVALALLLAAGRPPARLAAAGTGQGLAAAVGPALARELAQLAPAIGVAGAAPARRLARPAGVARAPLLAVGAPVLCRATCGGKKIGEVERRVRNHREVIPGEGWRRWGALTGAAVCAEEAGFAAAKPRSHAHLVRPAGVLAFAQRCRGTSGCANPTRVAPRVVPSTSRTPSGLVPPSAPSAPRSVGSWGLSTALRGRWCGGNTQPSVGTRILGVIHPRLTSRALPPFLLPAGAACQARGGAAGQRGDIRWGPGGTSDGDRGWVRLCSASGLFG